MHSLLHFTQLLCYTFYDYILFINYIYSSLIFPLFLCKFVFLFFANLFFLIFVHFFFLSFSFSLDVFSCQYYTSTHLNILCNILFFFIYSLSFSFELLLNFFSSNKGVRERKSRAREKTMKITCRCWCLDAQVNGEDYDPMILTNAPDNEDHFGYSQHHIVKEFIC